MTDKKRTPEPPLKLDMGFDEALLRFAQTKPEEVDPAKGKKPKLAKTARQLAPVAKAKPDDYKPER